MTYNEFKAEYNSLLKLMLSYSLDQIGSMHYCSKLADLVDAYPHFEEMLDNENDMAVA